MKFVWVSPTNVTKIAKTLLQLDCTHLREPYRQDASYFTDSLHRALAQYQTPPHCEIELKTWWTIESIEAALIHLLTEVKSYLNLLTPEAQQRLAQQFQLKKISNK